MNQLVTPNLSVTGRIGFCLDSLKVYNIVMPRGIYIRTEKTLEKLRSSLTGRKLSTEHRLNIGLASEKRSHSPESKLKISQALKGHEVSEKTRDKIKLARSKQVITEEHKTKISKALKNNPLHQGDKHWNWKGDEIGYGGLHRWVEKHLGKPALCDNCFTTTAEHYDWANLSGEYKRDLADWARLCRLCHNNIDGIVYKSWKIKRDKKTSTAVDGNDK